MSDGHIEDVLARIETDLASGDFAGRSALHFDRLIGLVPGSLTRGDFAVPPDPFKGTDQEAPADPNFHLTMFWRMFDRTPASMIQGIAIPVRRMLAERIFRSCGEGVIFHHNVLFSRGENIRLGDGVLVNRNAMLDDRGPIDVGSYTMLAAGVTIETHTHPLDTFERPIAYAGRGTAPVRIGANSVVGYNAVVMAGSSIGYRCIVGANSVVTGDVEDYSVVGGVPARPIKQILPVGEDPVRAALDAGDAVRGRWMPAL